MPELESTIENRLIDQLSQGESQWTYCPELNTDEKLWQNLRSILESNNRDLLEGQALSEQEFEQVKNQLTFSSFYDAGRWIVGENGIARVHIRRDSKDLHLRVLNRAHVNGGSSVYQIINQMKRFKDGTEDGPQRDRRFDVTLLINGLPLIHIELKNRNHSYKEAYRQIVKYVKEGQFSGLFSCAQMFVVSNDVDTKYIAAARFDELNAKFLSGWVDEQNKTMPKLTDFAQKVLRIPEAHELITQYTVLDQDKKRIILLRPYQIHAIEAVRSASRRGESGYIWHTTGSGKTLTSYKVARNLLQDIPSIEKTVFLIDRTDLDQQTSGNFQSYSENDIVDVDDVENVSDLKKKLKNKSRQMIVTTRQKLQTLLRKLSTNPESKDYQHLRNLKIAFVVDECHRAISPKTKRIIETFFIKSMWYGFTGTPRFGENSYPEMGDLPRTTEELYGNLLHSYNIKDAIHDNAVLGFQVEHLGVSGLETDSDGNNINEDFHYYESETHMMKILDFILNKSYEKLGIKKGAGRTYEAILTTSSIAMAQKYYELLSRIKKGNSTITVSEEIKRVLPDFPKFAITYSVGNENADGANANQEQMKKSLADYNEMFGTKYDIDQIRSYNNNLNDRLARKSEKYRIRSEQLDLVIVVDRLLTGFDSPSLSTLYIDRQPMQLHNILQAFSRTNRIFDADKTYGQILTFQSPGTFKNAVDNMLRLFSQGGETSAMAPSWEHIESNFIKALETLRIIAPTPDDIANMSIKEKRSFIRIFQKFDAAFNQLKSHTKFLEKNLATDYSLTEDEYDSYVAHYKNCVDELKNDETSTGDPDNLDDFPDDPPTDFDYELLSYGKEQIDYEYIVRLMQDFVSDEDLRNDPEKYERQKEDITKYIQTMQNNNPRLGSIMMELWQRALSAPQEYKGQNLMVLLENTKKNSLNTIIHNICAKWQLDEDTVTYSANQYHSGSVEIPAISKIKDTADYAKYCEIHGAESLKRYKYQKAFVTELENIFNEEILPLKKDNNM